MGLLSPARCARGAQMARPTTTCLIQLETSSRLHRVKVRSKVRWRTTLSRNRFRLSFVSAASTHPRQCLATLRTYKREVTKPCSPMSHLLGVQTMLRRRVCLVPARFAVCHGSWDGFSVCVVCERTVCLPAVCLEIRVATAPRNANDCL